MQDCLTRGKDASVDAMRCLLFTPLTYMLQVVRVLRPGGKYILISSCGADEDESSEDDDGVDPLLMRNNISLTHCASALSVGSAGISPGEAFYGFPLNIGFDQSWTEGNSHKGHLVSTAVRHMKQNVKVMQEKMEQQVLNCKAT